MAGLTESTRKHFPLQSSQSVVTLFKQQLNGDQTPDLALLSIVAGAVENALTVNRAVPSQIEASKGFEPIFPVVELSTIEALYSRFVSLVRGSVDLTAYPSTEYATRNLVKRVSDVIWNSLTRTYYKDKAHLQSLYSFLTGNKLDCFGLAFAVVAGCQTLGFNDVHLALSEDHAWVVYGEDGTETAEVTWHGKGNEDKRGQPITVGVAEKSWLYLNGEPVVCDWNMEVAALISSINPALTASMDSVELATLQQDLLWVMYDLGTLDKYPMALGNLGDLEEACGTKGRPSPEFLYLKAVEASQDHYRNQHVYPYTYLGGYYYRQRKYREAIMAWCSAAEVIKQYNYNREDEEIYKEFLEIANDLIPHMMRECTDDLRPNKPSVLRDPECYSRLLQFYDGICEWEEGSSTPVLHIGWAKQLVYSLSKFEGHIRGMCSVQHDSDSSGSESEEEEKLKNQKKEDEIPQKKPKRGRPPKAKPTHTTTGPKINGTENTQPNNNHEEASTEPSREDRLKSAIEDLESKVSKESQGQQTNPNIDALAKACGESILNPEYLLGGGDNTVPFTSAETKVDFPELLTTTSNSSPFAGMTMDSVLTADSPAELMMSKSAVEASKPGNQGNMSPKLTDKTNTVDMNSKPERELNKPELTLNSAKMRGLRSLLTNPEKFNASAIKLQLTAQSQVHLKHSRVSSEYDHTLSRKRGRRE